MWRTRIDRWADRVTFADPASEEAIRDCEVALGQSLPAALAELLRESDGIDDEYGSGLVWSTRRIASRTMIAPGLAAYLE